MATDELQKTFASSVEDLDTMYEESGNIGLDMALTHGKRIPIGSSIILAATKGAGKTTTLKSIAGILQFNERDTD